MAAARFGSIVRQFSTSSARCQLTTAPIQVFGVEGRYAHALYSAASKQKALDSVEKEVKGFESFMALNPKFAEYMNNPIVKRREKKDTINKMLTHQKLNPLTINLFTAIAENGRTNKINDVINAFGKIMSAHRGEIVCSVTTAKPLDAATLKELTAALQGFMKKGETLQLETQVDPAIMGGMIVNIGDRYVDMSTASKINTYTNLIKQAV